MKYVVLIILGLATATTAVAQKSRGGEGRSYPSLPGSSSRMVPGFSSPRYIQNAPPASSSYSKGPYGPPMQTQPGAGPMMVLPPGTNSRYPSTPPSSKSYKYNPSNPTLNPGVDAPFTRNRMMRYSEEQRSSPAPGASSKSSTKLKSRTPASTPENISYPRLVPGYDRPTVEPQQLHENLKGSTSRIQSAIEQQNIEEVGPEVESVRTNINEMKGRLRNQPVESRLKISSIERLYNDGATHLEEGQRTGDRSKMELGLEKIKKANEQFEEIQ